MTTNTTTFDTIGADQVVMAGKKIESVFKKTEGAYKKYTSSVSKSIGKGGFSGVGGGISSIGGGGSALAEIAAFGAIGKLGDKLLDFMPEVIGKKYGEVADNIDLRLKTSFSKGWKNISRGFKILGRKAILRPLKPTIDNTKLALSGIKKSINNEFRKVNLQTRKGFNFVGKSFKNVLAKPIQSVVSRSAPIANIASAAFRPMTTALRGITSGAVRLIGTSAAGALGAVAAAAGGLVLGAVLLDRRVQTWFSELGDKVYKEYIKPTLQWFSDAWEGLKTGVQKISGGIIQSKSLNTKDYAERAKRIIGSEEEKRFLNKVRVSEFKKDTSNGNQETINATIKELQQLIEKSRLEFNKQIDDIIETQKYTRRN